MSILTHLMALVAGATLGILVIALVSINRQDAEDDDEMEDGEVLDFLQRNGFGLHAIQQGEGSVMWAVVNPNPTKIVGDLAFDPRAAARNGMVLMLEKGAANATGA